MRILALAGAVWVAGCGSPRGADELRSEDLRGLSGAKRIDPPVHSDGPAARINGEPVLWNELTPLLAEASGGTILREVALDRAVRAECRRCGIAVAGEAIAAEEDRLLDSIERDAATPREESGVLLESIRRSRGLGEARYRKLLERNAMLRALVKDSIQVSGSDVEQAILMMYGERFRVRVVVMSSERELTQLREELQRQPAIIDVVFARAASLRSTDASAVRGGLLEPINPADPTYPAALRASLPDLETGRISPIIGVDRGFAIMLLDSKVPATIPPADALDQVRAEVRLRKERLAMEAEAKRLLAGTKVAPLAPELERSWRNLPAP